MSLPVRRSLVVLTGLLLAFALVGVGFYWRSLAQLKRLELDRVQHELQDRAEWLAGLADSARSGALAIAQSSTVATYLDSKTDAERRGLTTNLVAMMKAYPQVQQLRLIAADEEGRELVRVDRGAYGEPPRVVAEELLQRKGHRDYVQAGLHLESEAVLLTPIELNREHGDWERPFRPVLRSVTPVFRPGRGKVALVVVNVDLTQALTRLQRLASADLEVACVDLDGQILSHHDMTQAYGLANGSGRTIRMRYPEWDAWVSSLASDSLVMGGEAMAASGVVVVPVKMEGDGTQPTMGYLVSRSPDRLVKGMMPAFARLSLVATVVLTLGLLVLLAGMWRYLLRPLDRIIEAVDGYEGTGKLVIPVRSNSELKRLAQSIETMSAEIDKRTTVLHAEVAERHRTQTALEAILATLPDALMVVGADRRVQFANRQAKALFETGKGALEGEVVPVPYRTNRLMETEWNRGALRHLLQIRAVDFVWSGQPASLVMVRDCTELRDLQLEVQQSGKLKAVGEVASGVAHDFNNLLAVITLSAELLQARGLVQAEEAEDLMADLVAATKRAKGVTSQLLAFSRRSVGPPELLQLADVVREMLGILRRVLGEKVTLSDQLEADTFLIRADRGEMEQVILNLVLNGRDAMADGGALHVAVEGVTLTAAREIGNARVPVGEYARLSVRDEGCGMAPEVMAHVFEPFFSTKEKGRGTGMGLANVAGIVQRAQGVIGVRSEVGRGSCFEVYLPRGGEEVEAPELGARSDDEALRGQEHVLVVDDQQTLSRLIRHVLEDYGYRVSVVSDGVAALAWLQSDPERVDLALVDLVMQPMGGRELARRMRERGLDIPVLFMTGYTSGQELKEADVPSTTLLLKPFTPVVLLRRIRDVFATESLTRRGGKG